MGDHYLDSVPDALKRASGGLAVGIYSSEEMCGVVSGGTLVLGALWGRDAPTESTDRLRELCQSYRYRFIQRFGTTTCGIVRSQQDALPKHCHAVVADGTRILLELIEEARGSE